MAGVLFVICANALNVYNPIITKDAVDLIAKHLKDVHTSGELTTTIQTQIGWQVFYLFLKYLAVALMAGGFTFLMRQTIIVVSRKIEFDLKNDIYEHYQKLDLAFYRRNNTGDLMNRITEDVSRVRMYMGPAVMYSVNLIFAILFALTSMLLINPVLTMWVMIPFPILSFIIYYVNELVEKTSTEIQTKLSELTTNAQETYSGIRVIQAYTREKDMMMHFERESEEYKQKQLKMAKINSVYFPIMIFLIGCSIIIVVYVGGIQVGQQKLSPGALAAFLMYTNMLMWPVSALGWTASIVQRAIASQKRINDFLDQQPTVKDEISLEKEIKGDIVFENVSFTYPDTGLQALKDISFHIKPGQRLAIIGRTGSGKTTLADLLMRMYDATQGEIRIDGTPIKEFQLGSLRRQIGFVPQDVFLFSETISENITFGLDESDEETASRFAEYASIKNEIEEFPMGFKTMVGERGVTLSGGQKQRISIARALAKQPNILLLDDSLSAVDTATEKRIQQNLEKVLDGKTAIIITHRIFSLMRFDNIIVLDDGRIIEQGKHQELLDKAGAYADIYNRQLTEQKNESVAESL